MRCPCSHSRETSRTLVERGNIDEECAAEVLRAVESLRQSVIELKDRVDSQFTTIAAHAEIARQQAELARNEARADLERTRDTLIGLIEQVRAEGGAMHVTGSAPGPSGTALNERFDAVEIRLGELASLVDRCFARQNELAETVAAFIDTVLAEARDDPVTGLSLA